MIKFIIAGRRKREDTQQRYFYEWGIIHVALMLSTPAVMQIFKRYVQHYTIAGIGNDSLIHPLSDMEWDNMADHWVESHQALVDSVRVEDYVKRMQPHVFGDKAFALEIAKGEVIYEQDNFTSGGVKLIHFLKKKEGVSDEEFCDYWRNHHAKILCSALEEKGLLRKYVQNRKEPIDPAFFQGTLFQMGGVNAYGGVEEFWFDSVEDMSRLRLDEDIYRALTESEKAFIEPSESFSMVTTERVIYDYTKGEKSSPMAAVLNPDSLEAQVFRQGLEGWNAPPQRTD